MLSLLTVCTALVEMGTARERAAQGVADSHLRATALAKAHNNIVHPLALPVMAGLLWNALGWRLPQVMDEVLLTLSQAVVPLRLVLIGLFLAHIGRRAAVKGPPALSGREPLVLSTVVLIVSRWRLGLSDLPLAVVAVLAVVAMMAAAALPVGTNTLIFPQRYNCLQAEVTASTLFATAAFLFTAALWWLVLRWPARVPVRTTRLRRPDSQGGRVLTGCVHALRCRHWQQLSLIAVTCIAFGRR